ncbi:MAG: SRPBCC family protein [Actinomycetota bacterium]
MATYAATINVDASPEDAFAYLADPANRGEWDPSVRSVTANGDGTFAVVVGFYGRAIDAVQEVAESTAPTHIIFTTSGKVKGRDVITIAPRDGGSSVTIDLDVQLRGLARVLDRGLQVAFAGIGDNIASEMTRRLNRQSK